MEKVTRKRSRSPNRNNGRTKLHEVAGWGWISPAAGKRLTVNNPRRVAMMRLSPSPTIRSFGQSILAIFEELEPYRATTSQVWSTVFQHFSRCRFEMLIVAGVHYLGDGSQARQSPRSVQLCDALRTVLNQGVSIGFIGAQSEVQFLLYDWQLQSRCVGSLSFPGEQPA